MKKLTPLRLKEPRKWEDHRPGGLMSQAKLRAMLAKDRAKQPKSRESGAKATRSSSSSGSQRKTSRTAAGECSGK